MKTATHFKLTSACREVASNALPDKTFGQLYHLLVGRRLINFVVALDNPTPLQDSTLVDFLTRILDWTLGCDQVLEKFSKEDLEEGNLQVGIPWPKLGRQTVRRALLSLEEQGWLLRVATQQDQAMFLALDIPKIVERIVSRADALPTPPNGYTVRFLEALVKQASNPVFVAYADSVRSLHRTEIDLSKSVQGISTTIFGERMGELSDLTAKIGKQEIKAREGSLAKLLDTKLVSTKLKVMKDFGVKESQVYSGKACFGIWNKSLGDTDRYGAATEVQTREVILLMHQFVQERHKSGMPEEDIREQLQLVVNTWHVMHSTAKTVMSYVKKDGNEYTIPTPIPKIPSFRFYFSHRDEMDNMAKGFKHHIQPKPAQAAVHSIVLDTQGVV